MAEELHMVDEKDLQKLLITTEEKSWHSKWIAPQHGWLDWDADAWALENTRFFLHFFLAFDVEIRGKYLKKRAQNEASDAPDVNFEENFLRNLLAESRARGEKDFARKSAALYFAFDDELRNWYQNVFLNEEKEWVYTPERDDFFLAKLLADGALRVKTPNVVRRVFSDWTAPYCGTLTFRKANKKYYYHPENFFSDVYERIVGQNGRRRNVANGVAFWLTTRPTETLREWFELETIRELDRALKQRQRARLALRLVDDLRKLGEKAATTDKSLTSPVDVQALFDALAAESPTEALLLSAYWGADATFSEIAMFWSIGEEKPIDGKALNKRYERALDHFREICERILEVGIPKERWKKIVAIFLKSDAQADKAKEEGETPSRLKETKSERLKRVRFVEPPTKDEQDLLLNVLEAKRIDETGCFIRLMQQNTQGGGFNSSNVVLPVPARRLWGDPVKAREEGELRLSSDFQRPLRICGAPIDETYDAELARQYWRNRCAENSSIIFYYDAATEAPGAPNYWRLEARIPLFATSDEEMCFLFGGYNSLYSAPYSVALGDITVPVIHGVAIFKVADFRAAVKNGEMPRVTVLLRCVEDGKRGKRWHVKAVSPVRLLLRQPVVPEDER